MAQKFQELQSLSGELDQISEQLKECKEDEKKELNTTFYRKKLEFQKKLSELGSCLGDMNTDQQSLYVNMMQKKESLNYTDNLNASKQNAEERIKQELGMHHILPTRPEELHKVILIYVAILKIYFASSQQQKCDQLINELQNETTRAAALKKANTFFNEEKIKGTVKSIEQLIHTTFDRFHAGALIKTMSRFISYPLADFVLVTGLSDCFLPSDESQPRLAPAH